MRGARGSTRIRKPYVKPVQKIELSEDNTKVRFIFTIVFLVIGAVALGIFAAQLLGKDSGWREIDSDTPGISEEIIFNYNLGSGGLTASAEHRAIALIYSDAAQTLYKDFNSQESYDGVNNLYTINHAPNEVVTVDAYLYDALEKMVQKGGRLLYMAPLYAEYINIFSCENDQYAAYRDPNKNEDTAAYYSEIAHFYNDPEMIELELLGEGRVCLHVDQEYLAWVSENYVEQLIDFTWVRNAFILDALAQVMVDAGYTAGNLSSCDGFTRNLDQTGRFYSYNIYDRYGYTVYSAAALKYERPMAIVFMRNYPMAVEQDQFRYYSYADGEIATVYLDEADGCYRSALHNVVSYSETQGCADIVLALAPIYIAETFDAQALQSLTQQGIYSVWGDDAVLYYNEKYVSLGGLYSDEVLTYRKEFVGE